MKEGVEVMMVVVEEVLKMEVIMVVEEDTVGRRRC